MSADYVALAGRIRQALLDIEHLVNRAESLMDKALRSGDDGYWDGVALNLHGFYGGIERIFEDIARTMERAMPAGPDWRLDLLLQMSSEIAAVRPPVITQETRYRLDEYRGFRHVVRNVYVFNLRPARLQELATQLRGCYQDVARDLDGFAAFLAQLSVAGEQSPGHP